jgi:hypothetical protein
MRDRVDAAALTAEDLSKSKEIFGTRSDAAQRYANYETRRRIIANYVWKHPATIRLQLAFYQSVRDINPIHFVFERGWQVGSGKEMFTKRDVSRLRAAVEFFTFLAVSYGASRVLSITSPTGAGNGLGIQSTGSSGPRWNPARSGHIFRTIRRPRPMHGQQSQNSEQSRTIQPIYALMPSRQD